MVFQVKCLLIFSVIIQFVAFVTGILSLALPFWIDAEHDEGEVVVKVLRKSHSGLWFKHDTFEIQENRTSESKWDETLQFLYGSPLDTTTLQAVKWLMISGLFLELLCLIGSIVVCCISEKKYLKHMTTIGIGMILASWMSFILMLIGPIVFVSKVIHDYEYDRKELDVGFWLAVVSVAACFVAAVLSTITYICFWRKKKTHSQRNIVAVSVLSLLAIVFILFHHWLRTSPRRKCRNDTTIEMIDAWFIISTVHIYSVTSEIGTLVRPVKLRV